MHIVQGRIDRLTLSEQGAAMLLEGVRHLSILSDCLGTIVQGCCHCDLDNGPGLIDCSYRGWRPDRGLTRPSQSIAS